jgi:hypothetical protein
MAMSMPTPTPTRRRRAGRVFEWFWGRRAMAELRARRRAQGSARELDRRARSAVELGRRVMAPAKPFLNGPADGLACELYGQAVYWALLARRAARADASAEADALDAAALPPMTPAALEALVADTDGAVLARAAGSREAARELVREAGARSFVEHAERPAVEEARLAWRLLAFAEALGEDFDPVRGAVEGLWTMRALRTAVLAAVIGASALAVWLVRDRMEQARDLAKGRPWVASSRYPEFGCVSPAQECPNSDVYFFSTDFQDNPTIEWDLGKPERVSGVRVKNRKEVSDRAVPLIVEVSLDHVTWKEVARRNDDFGSWKGSFPAVQARWVRLRVPRQTLLHLRAVRILR